MNIPRREFKSVDRELVHTACKGLGIEYNEADEEIRDTQEKAEIVQWNQLCDDIEKFLGDSPTVEQLANAINIVAGRGVQPFAFFGFRGKEYWGGSCQYATIGDVFYSRVNLRDLSFEEWQRLFRVKVSWKAANNDVKNAIAQIYQDELDYQQANPEDTDEEDAEELEQKIAQLEVMERVSVQEGFMIGCHSAWDLWSAIPEMTCNAIKGLEVEVTEKSPTWGPVLNVMAQSENYELGLMCVALLETGLITVEDTEQWSFDT